MKNSLFILVCLAGFSYSFANSELPKESKPTESVAIVDGELMNCQLLADTTVLILNNMGFPESGTQVIGNIILGLCENIFD